MFQLLLADTTSTLVRSALDKMHSFGLVPRSRYTTSWEGLTFKQAIHMPLPPYLSPIPVIFRMMAYAVITPFVLLLFLDIGGYIVWRIYEGVSLTGTRTAFYKFRTSPVFVRSRTGSPVIGKGSNKVNNQSNSHDLPDSTVLGPSPPRSPPGTRETSISPISSSASLQDETYGMNSDGELVSHSSSSASSSPPSRHDTLLYDTTGFSMGDNSNNSTALSNLDTANLDASIRRRAISRHSANRGSGSIGNSNKRFSVGSDDGDDDKYGGAAEERESTPTLASSSSTSVNPLHLTRSNSLGLGFNTRAAEPSSASPKDSDHVSQQQQQQPPTMYIASSSSTTNRDQPSLSSRTKQMSSAEDLVKVERSPAASTASTASSANLEEEDDRIFREAKEVTGGQS